MSSRRNVLNMYKNMLKLAKSLPTDKRYDAIISIRHQFRSKADESNNDEIVKLLQKAESSLGYLKMVTPKVSTKQSGVTKIIFSGGDDKRTGKAYSNWIGSNMDPDSVKRHQNSLKRAGFRDNNHAKGIF